MRLRKLLPLFIVLLLPFLGNAQVTTSSIVGVVTTSAGSSLEGASITATHTPSGTVYRTISRSGGNFTIPNMRVGGPYTIIVTYVGLESQTYNDIYLQLGEDTKLSPVLVDKSQSLADVTVATRRNSLIGKDKIGTSIQISPQQLQMMPSISRNYADFVRASPIAQVRSSSSDGSPAGISFGGASTRYNQFSIDGANATDVFGLSPQGTNGGQAYINPIPFESIDQLQVVMAPYDVTQSGFTGGGMNAVTKSGTNEFHGSAYGYFQNQDLVGKSMTTPHSKYADFKNWQYGASLGGAIIKNKLFFFANYEGMSRSQPIANQPGAAGTSSQIDVSKAEALRQYVIDNYKYDPGAINGLNSTRKSNSVFARIDWNINEKNKLMIRDNYVKGSNYILSDGTSSMSFGNNGYTFSTKTNSVVAELNSNISSKASNLLRLTYTAIRDKRDVGSPFPSVTISDAGATYKLGSDYSSQANSLNQNIFTLTDNYNIYAGAHTITIGTDNMYYKTSNVFLQGVFGDYSFNSLSGFMSDTSQGAMTQYQTTYSNDKNNPLGTASIKMGSFSLYAQDAWNIKSNFKLTYGLRADLTTFFNDPVANPTFNKSPMATDVGVLNNQPPKASLIVSPRVGFNWDVFNNGQTQVRGGIGIFAGRVPMVWVSNQYSNTGVATTKYTANNAAIVANNITFSPGNPYQGTPTGVTATEVDVTARNFQAPRSLRTNLAIDQKLPWGIIGTIEGVYTKVIKDIAYQDLNLEDPATMSIDLGNGVSRPFYNNTRYDATNFTNLLYLYNTNKGHAYNVYVKFEKPFSKGWYASASYSLGHSYGLNDGTSSTALSNYRYAYNINGLNHLTEARNNTDQGSRVLINIGKKFTYGNFATNIGLFYTGQSGQTLTYVFYGDLNGDDGSTLSKYSTAGGADIMYVPNSAADFVDIVNSKTGAVTTSAADEYAAWQQYVNSDPYLKKNLGKNLARNGSRLPWENHVDFKFAEDWHMYKSHTLTLSVDIFNVGNLIDKNWGKAYYAGNQELQPLDVVGFTQNGGSITPKYQFNPQFGDNKDTHKPWAYSDYLSRWSMQIGLHYSF